MSDNRQIAFSIVCAVLILSFVPVSAQVAIDPLGMTISLAAEDTTQKELNVRNETGQDLEFAIEMVEVLPEERDAFRRNRRAPHRDDRGGPDNFGYTWRDSDEPGGPLYDWIDIRQIGQRLQAEDDWRSGNLDLGFDFAFYGNVYRAIDLCSNGWASFTDHVNTNWNSWELPIPQPPTNLIAPYWADLDPAFGGAMYWWTDNVGEMAVFSWIEVPHHWSQRRTHTFQMILYNGNRIRFQYADDHPNESDYTLSIGIQNQDGSDGLSAFFWNSAGGTPAEYAIEFAPEWLDWIIFDAYRGVLEAHGNRDLRLTINSTDLEDGVYEVIIHVKYHSREEDPVSPLVGQVEFSAVLSVESDVANVRGVVSAAQDNEPIEGARVDNDIYIVSRHSGEGGAYTMENLPLGGYELTFSRPEYLPATEVIELDEGGDYELDVGLLHGECNPEWDDWETELSPNTDFTRNLQVSNPGDGLLTYTIKRHFPVENIFEPWSVRNTLPAQELLNSARVYGVAFAEGSYYIAQGSGDDNAAGSIRVLNEDFEFVDNLEQPAPDYYGIRDLTWDGEFLWGAIGSQVYQINPADGEVVRDFLFQEGLRSMAWDPDLGVLWSSETITSVYAIDPEDGSVVRSFPRFGDIRTFGLSYYPEDPDGYNLYMFGRSSNLASDLAIFKRNTGNGDVRLVVNLDEGQEETPNGIFITDKFDAQSWVLMGMVASRAREVRIWQIDARKDWMRISPEAGVIDAESNVDFAVTLDATGLPEELFEGRIVFQHDGFGLETALDISLDVVQGSVHTIRPVELNLGWNLVSQSIDPDEPDLNGLIAGLVNDGTLVIVKDGAGNFCYPAGRIDDIGDWAVSQGYLIKTTRPGSFDVEGWTMLCDDPIALRRGWQYMAYYPRVPVDATIALSGIVDRLVIAKDVRGNFYVPAWGFSSMGELMNGQGYQVFVSADVELVYRQELPQGMPRPEPGERRLQSVSAWHGHPARGVESYLPPTGFNMSLLLVAGESQSGVVTVYAGDLLVGAGWLEGGRCGLAVWGDDPTTEEIDGATDGAALTVLFDGVTSDVKLLQGSLSYATDALAVGELDGASSQPLEFGLLSAYPNPFNSLTRVSFSVPSVRQTFLSVYDLSGRKVADLWAGQAEAGVHEVTFDAEGLSSGVYVIQLESAGQTARMKVALVR